MTTAQPHGSTHWREPAGSGAVPSVVLGRLVNPTVPMALEWNWGDPLPYGLVFTGDANRTKIDASGVVHTVGANVPRNDGYVFDKNGLLVPGWLLEASRTNLVIQSQSINTASGWSANGLGVTVTGGQTDPFGTTLASKLDPTGSSGGLARAIAFTGDGEKCGSVFVKQGTAPVTLVSLFDSTAGVHRHAVLITWHGSSAPTLSDLAGSGTRFTPQPLVNGYWRISWSAPGVVAANSNLLILYADDSTGTPGHTTIYVGAQVEDAKFPSSYIPTAAATVTRAAEVATVPWYRAPQAMAIYAKFVERGTALVTAYQAGVLALTDPSANVPELLLYCQTPGYGAFHHNGVSGVASGQPTPPILGDAVELMVALASDGTVTVHQSLNGGADASSGSAGLAPFATAWSSPLLHINDRGAGTIGFAAFQSIRLALGARTLRQMQKLDPDPARVTPATTGAAVASLVNDGTGRVSVSSSDLTGTGRIAVIRGRGVIY